jgi:hypothetical protein
VAGSATVTGLRADDRTAPLSAGHHALGPLAPPRLALALASLALSEFGLGR